MAAEKAVKEEALYSLILELNVTIEHLRSGNTKPPPTTSVDIGKGLRDVASKGLEEAATARMQLVS